MWEYLFSQWNFSLRNNDCLFIVYKSVDCSMVMEFHQKKLPSHTPLGEGKLVSIGHL